MIKFTASAGDWPVSKETGILANSVMQVQRGIHFTLISDHTCKEAKTEKTSECWLYVDAVAEFVQICFIFSILCGEILIIRCVLWLTKQTQLKGWPCMNISQNRKVLTGERNVFCNLSLDSYYNGSDCYVITWESEQYPLL